MEIKDDANRDPNKKLITVCPPDCSKRSVCYAGKYPKRMIPLTKNHCYSPPITQADLRDMLRKQIGMIKGKRPDISKDEIWREFTREWDEWDGER